MKKYELEVIGSKWETHYVYAQNHFVSDRTIQFLDTDQKVIAVYPIDITIIKSIQYA